MMLIWDYGLWHRNKKMKMQIYALRHALEFHHQTKPKDRVDRHADTRHILYVENDELQAYCRMQLRSLPPDSIMDRLEMDMESQQIAFQPENFIELSMPYAYHSVHLQKLLRFATKKARDALLFDDVYAMYIYGHVFPAFHAAIYSGTPNMVVTPVQRSKVWFYSTAELMAHDMDHILHMRAVPALNFELSHQRRSVQIMLRQGVRTAPEILGKWKPQKVSSQLVAYVTSQLGCVSMIRSESELKQLMQSDQVVILFTNGVGDESAFYHHRQFAQHYPHIRFAIVNIADVATHYSDPHILPVVAFYRHQVRMNVVEKYSADDWVAYTSYLEYESSEPQQRAWVEVFSEKMLQAVFASQSSKTWYLRLIGVFYVNPGDPHIEDMKTYFRCAQRDFRYRLGQYVIAYRNRFWEAEAELSGKFLPYCRQRYDLAAIGYIDGKIDKISEGWDEIDAEFYRFTGGAKTSDEFQKVKPEFLYSKKKRMVLAKENVAHVQENGLIVVMGNMINKKFKGADHPIVLVRTDIKDEITTFTRFAWPSIPTERTFVFVLQQARQLLFFGLYDPATMPMLVNNMFNMQCFASPAGANAPQAKKAKPNRPMLAFPHLEPPLVFPVVAIEDVYQYTSLLWDVIRNPDAGLSPPPTDWWIFLVLMICRSDTFEMRYRAYMEGVVDQEEANASLDRMAQAQKMLAKFQSMQIPAHARNVLLDLNANFLEL